MIYNINSINRSNQRQQNNSICKKIIFKKIKEIKQYRIVYDNPPAFGSGEVAGVQKTPSIFEIEQRLNSLYKLLFDNHDTHTGLIDEIEKKVKEL